MGIAAVVSSSAPAAGEFSVLSRSGVGAAGIFVTALLVFLLAYLNVIEAGERDRRDIRSLLIQMVGPLAFAFATIILYESLSTIGILQSIP